MQGYHGPMTTLERTEFRSRTLVSRELVRPDRALRSTSIRRRLIELPPNVRGLRPFQVEGVHWLRPRDRALLSDEMGLGKSAQVLRALPSAARAILVCPASLRLLWRDQVATWRPDLHVRIARDGARRGELVPKRGEIVIINYEGLPEPIGRRLLVRGDLGDVVVICDEAHYLKNPEAERTQRARALVRQVEQVKLLTATPLLGNPEDLWGLLETGNLHRRAFGSRSAFVEMFGGRRRRGGYEWTATEFSAPYAALRRVMLRRRRVDVLPELPQKSYTRTAVELGASSPALDEADRAWKLLGATTLPPFHDLAGAMAELARLKIPAMLDSVRRYEDEQRPLLVFAAHVDPILALERREGWAIIHGDTKDADDHAAIARFQRGELRGLGLTIQKGGVGHNLTHAAHELFVSLAYTPALNEQAEDRPVRFGQTARSVEIEQLVADHPLDHRLFEILHTKEAMIAGVVG